MAVWRTVILDGDLAAQVALLPVSGTYVMTAGEAGLAYNLLELRSYKPVLDNIVYLGLKNGVDCIAKNPGRRRNTKLFMLGDV